MHHSDELSEVIGITHKMLSELKVKHDTIAIQVFDADNKSSVFWPGNSLQEIAPKVVLPYDEEIMKEDTCHRDLWEAMSSGEAIINKVYTKKQKDRWFKYVFAHNDSTVIEEHARQFILLAELHTVCFFPEKYSGLFADSWDGRQYVEEEIEVLKRATRVFEQAYVRFLDLQNAEAQAREAQIQLALERVRARAMAMQKSGDLREVVKVLYTQLKELGFQWGAAAITIMDGDEGSIDWWMEGFGDGYDLPEKYHVPYFNHKGHNEQLGHWRDGREYAVIGISGEEKRAYDSYYFFQTDFKVAPERSKNLMMQQETVLFSMAYMQYGALCWSPSSLSEEQAKILQRFAKAFQQCYTRFLDLQKAEAQAREAQIEAALEKIRSRSLAMHHSNEMKEVIAVMFKTMHGLEVLHDSIAIQLFDYKTMNSFFWVGNLRHDEPPMVNLPYDEKMMSEESYLRDSWEVRRTNTSIINKEYSRAQKDDYFEYVMANNNTETMPQHVRESISNAASHIVCLFVEKNSALFVDSFNGKFYDEESINILKRAARVFEQAYTRFLDLQKAEAQAREAQIEAALEKVRSSSLAMHQSNELKEIAAIVFDKLRALDFRVEEGAAVILIFSDFSKDHVQWIADPGQSYPMPFEIPYTDHLMSVDLINAKKNNLESYSKLYSVEEKNSYFNYLFQHTDYKNLPDFVKQSVLESDRFGTSVVLNKHSGILFPTNKGNLLTESEMHILKRFARVFEQAYVRFLDLQKAETQAREAQVEAALERVRSRTMAMHNSSELIATAELVFDQLRYLGAETMGVAFAICEPDEIMVKKWTNIGIFSIPYTAEEGERKMYEAWKNQEELHEEIYEGERIQRYYELFLKFPAFKVSFDKHLANGYTQPAWQKNHAAIFKYGYLLLITTKPFDETRIFVRFAKVFEQTYTRFLDLQKAEAQAREAQIEAALERVRSRSLAMHNTSELSQVIFLLYQELRKLDFALDRSIIIIFHPEQKETIYWMAGPEGLLSQNGFSVPYFPHAFNDSILEYLGVEDASWNGFLGGKEKKDWDDFAFSHTDLSKLPSVVKESMKSFGDVHFTVAGDAYGGLLVSSSDMLTNIQSDVVTRFSKVFNQCYTRFLDLQKAEAQAREAQIETALERVRGRSMAMQKSNELTDVAGILFKQITDLGIKTWTTGFNVWSDDNDSYIDYITSPAGGFIEPYKVITTDFSVLREVSDAKKSGQEFLVQYVEGDLLRKTYETLSSFADKMQFQKMLADGAQFPSHQYDHFVFGEKVSLMFITYDAVPEAHDIFKRFGRVFQQAYTRFLDLQKAETQAREAIQRSSVDRVRAEIASMRTTDDLERITPLIWNELTTIGVSFIRCGVFIMDEAKEQIHTFLSTPDGKAIGAFHLPYTSTNSSDIVQHWRDKKIYKTHWGENEYGLLADELIKQNAITSRTQFLNSVPTLGIYVNYVPFLQGMLYVGNTALLGEDDLKLVQALADSFSTAYARYEDFNRLEIAKKQVEKTLTDLKQTQQLLVQSEKMASLGELTAGIAHEIQNPLNFVNNFSEVSVELIDEIQIDLHTGNLKSLVDLVDKLKSNLNKINHHGKRAGDIVKGMLQHSRTTSAALESTNLNALADEYLRLAYHGLRAKDKLFNAKFETDFDNSLPKINVVSQDISRVILNLINNAFYAVNEKIKANTANYQPRVIVSTKNSGNSIMISIKDNGNGIPENIHEKIFQPFFTTKPTGEGTGLGLSISYDIVKAHHGKIEVKSHVGEGTEFIITLPFK